MQEQESDDDAEHGPELAPPPEPEPYGVHLLKLSIAWVPIAVLYYSNQTAPAILLTIFFGALSVGLAVHWYLWRTGRLG